MKKQWQVLRQQWLAYPLRTQRLLAALLLVPGSMLFYSVAWQPLSQQVPQLAQRVSRLQAEAQLVTALAREAAQLKAQPVVAVGNGAALQGLLQQQLQAAGIKGLTLQAEGEHGMRVSGTVAFDAWVHVAGQLAAQQIHIARLKADAGAQPGLVSLDALLLHGGAES